ncbi:Histidine kinase [Algoriphagus locisalis]|uniref:Histidine kinase n=1 Tax=Algoriphagus locisalis TaxID=305507 RepID=A0A1I7E8E1_9BACT|nr:histidine kinase [Algoriphagus locisalis]SFU20083.1 Histidine kinase [Algoriphagus locisalis]
MSRTLSLLLSFLLVLSLGIYLLYNGGLIVWLGTASWYQGAFLLISLLAGLGIHLGSRVLKRNPLWEQGNESLYIILFLLIWGILSGYSYLLEFLVNDVLKESIAENGRGLVLKGSVVGLILAIIIVWINYSWIAYAQFSKKTIQHLRNERNKEELQYKLLRSQLTPHFLFNSLNTASNLIATNPDQAESFIRKLAYNFKHLIKNGIQPLNSLEQELKIVENYMHLMKVRYGDKVILENRIKSEALDHQLPALAIQLLVENALKHNVASQEHPLKITITADRDKVVVNNSITRKPEQIPSIGIGLNNLKARYKLYGKQQISIQESQACFYVNLPFIFPGLAE